ncbi:MAG: hypothetical protein JXX28_12950 [Deltaproteobacteria bacterium]|nr:hypothetical protein [Deltaproteobacteria bacterium]
MSGFSFQVFGFPVEVRSGAFLLAGVVLLFGLSGSGLLDSLVWIAVAAFSILVHELGHALVARSMGLGPVVIALHGMGGTTTHRAPDRPYKTLLIALAGPAAGLALVPVALGLLMFSPEGIRLQDAAGALVWINVVWSLFNLLPIFPMDGGQALWGGLATFIPGKAALITGLVGFAGSLSLSIYFLMHGNWWVVFILGSMVMSNYRILQGVLGR